MKKEILKTLIKEAERKSHPRLQNAVEYGLKGSDVGMKSLAPAAALLSAINSDTDDPFMLNKMVHSGIMGGAIGSAGGGILGAGVGALKKPKEKNAFVQLGMNKIAEEESRLDKTKKWVKENPQKTLALGGLGAGALGGGLLANKKFNKTQKGIKLFNKGMDDLKDRIKKDPMGGLYREKLKEVGGKMQPLTKKDRIKALSNAGVVGGTMGAMAGAFAGKPFEKNKEKNAFVQLGMNKIAEEESRLDKTKKWAKENSTKIGLGVGAAAGTGLGLVGAKKLNQKYDKTMRPYFNTFKGMSQQAKELNHPEYKKEVEKSIKKLMKSRKKDHLMSNVTLGGSGLMVGGALGATLGDKVRGKEKEATIEKLAADYIDLKKNKRTGEFGTRKHNFKSDAKRYAPGLAGAGIGGFAANKLTKNKDNKTRNTLLGAAGGGTIGELARRMKKANVALKGENEAVITTFSPRRDDEMTEKLKRIIREYENDRG